MPDKHIEKPNYYVILKRVLTMIDVQNSHGSSLVQFQIMSRPQQSHNIRDWSIEEVFQARRQNWHIDVRPLERIHQVGHSLADEHQLVQLRGVDKHLMLKQNYHHQLHCVFHSKHVEKFQKIVV